jgi:thioredoxin reductase
LLERGRAEVRHYGGQVVAGEVTTAVRDTAGFTLALADGRAVRARRLLVASGLVDELPEVRGLRARWGREVVHCAEETRQAVAAYQERFLAGSQARAWPSG